MLKNLGEFISTDFEVKRLNTVSLRPNSDSTQTSSSEDPKDMCVIAAVPEVGLAILALN